MKPILFINIDKREVLNPYYWNCKHYKSANMTCLSTCSLTGGYAHSHICETCLEYKK